MGRIAGASAVLMIAAAPVFAQESEGTAEEGFNLLQEGARIILRSMIDEVEPTLKELHKEFGEVMDEMGPAMRELADMIGDIRNYHAPEMLPNGDIIIRRKSPEELALPAPGEEIEI